MNMRGGWMQTFTGRKIHPLSPDPENIFIEDIAHALSMICRFGGHCREFYSVAQHSVMVSEMCLDAALLGLLHDAAEAYLGDVIQPLKRELYYPEIRNPDRGPPVVYYAGLKEIEEDAMRTILHTLDLGQITTADWGLVGHADLVLLATERRDLMNQCLGDWECLRNIEPLPKRIEPWGPAVAEQRFLERYEMLRGRNG